VSIENKPIRVPVKPPAQGSCRGAVPLRGADARPGSEPWPHRHPVGHRGWRGRPWGPGRRLVKRLGLCTRWAP